MMVEYSDAKFKKMQFQLQQYFDDYFSQEDYLFRLNCDVRELWNLYLDSFPKEIKGIYHEKAWHDCRRCWSWFKSMANVVMIDDNYEIRTLFDFKTIPEYQDVFKILNDYLKTKSVEKIFLNNESFIGIFRSFAEYDGEFEECHHFYLDIPDKFCADDDNITSEIGDAITQRNLLEDTMSMISLEAIDTVLELVYSKNIYRSIQWKDTLEGLKDVFIEFTNLDSNCELNNWFWKKSVMLPRNITHIKNTSMGNLLIDISKGVDLEKALNKFDKITAPSNYQRPKAIYNSQMLEDAKKKVIELGYIDSLERRFAKLEDISINNVLFANRNIKSNTANGDIFDVLKKNVTKKVYTYDDVPEITLDEFINDVLPDTQEISLYLHPKFKNNFVSLIAPVNKDAPCMFQWDNPYSWTYDNNITDTLMKELVKKMGGDVNVDLRFSIQWNDEIWDKNDLDAHCSEPDGNEIYFSSKKSYKTGGWLDVDIITPVEGEISVENIQFKNKNNMIDGEYLFRVHQYTYRGGNDGFKAEIEFDDVVYDFDYPHKLSQDEYVNVAKVEVNNGSFILTDLLNGKQYSQHWNIGFNEFIPVSLICYSPNFWNDNEFGNKHIFFMLQDCINDTNPSGWFNEYLNNQLHPHKNVMEALSSKMTVEDTENQLSGVGFSLGKLGENRVTLKIKTKNISRIMNVII